MFWFWIGLILGIIIGWILEWILDWWFWRGDVGEIGTTFAEAGALAGGSTVSFSAGDKAELDAELAALRAELDAQQKLNTDLESTISTLKSESSEPEVVIKEVIKEVPVEVIKEVEVVKEVEVAKVVKQDAPDDLKKIKGIGKVYEGILNKGGVTTFEELANLTSESVQDIIGPENWQSIDIDSWVAQARELAAAKGDK